MNQLTTAYVKHMLLTDDRWLGRALVALNRNQTADEQREGVTRYHNEIGFCPMHAARGTSMARYYERNGFLTPKQLQWWRSTTASGKTRIEIYAAQLVRIAKERAINKGVAA